MDSEISDLIDKVRAHVVADSRRLCVEHENAARLQVEWHHYLASSEANGCCDEMLAGYLYAIREASAYICLGLVRPAVLALRLQIDTALNWLYYKDHPVEYRYVMRLVMGLSKKKKL